VARALLPAKVTIDILAIPDLDHEYGVFLSLTSLIDQRFYT